MLFKILFTLLSCTTNPCEDVHCLCTEGTGTLIIENIKEASIQKKQSSGKQAQIIPCSASKAGSICSFVPDGAFFQVEVLIGDKSFPVDIKSEQKQSTGCCSCPYFEFSPHRLTIPYH